MFGLLGASLLLFGIALLCWEIQKHLDGEGDDDE